MEFSALHFLPQNFRSFARETYAFFFAKQKKAKFFKKVKFLRANELRKNAKFSQNKLLFSMEIGHLAKVLNCTNVKWIFTQLKG